MMKSIRKRLIRVGVNSLYFISLFEGYAKPSSNEIDEFWNKLLNYEE